jgi:hypothetical protein
MTQLTTTDEVDQNELRFFEFAYSDWITLQLRTDSANPQASLRQLRERFWQESSGPDLNTIGVRNTFGDWLATLDPETTVDAYAALRRLRDAFISELSDAGLRPGGWPDLLRATVLFVRTVQWGMDHGSREAEYRQADHDFELRLSRLQGHVRGINTELLKIKDSRWGRYLFSPYPRDLFARLDESLLGRAMSSQFHGRVDLTDAFTDLDDLLQRYLLDWRKRPRPIGASAAFLDRVAAICQPTTSGGSFRRVMFTIYRALPSDKVRRRLANSEPALDRRVTRVRLRRKSA